MHRWLRAGSLSAAERSYPTSEVRGSGLECQAATAQERPRGATLCPRSGAAAERSYPVSEVRGGDPKEPPELNARGSSWEEPPMPEARASGQEEQPEEQWLRRHRRAYRSYPTLKVRNGGGKEMPHAQGKRNPSKKVGVARGHQGRHTETILTEN